MWVFLFIVTAVSTSVQRKAVEFNTLQYPINQICYIFPKYHILPTVTKLLQNLAAPSTVYKHLQ